MILQMQNSRILGKVKCFTGKHRFKLTTTVATQYMLHHHIRYVLENNRGVGQNLEKNGLDSGSQPNMFYIRCITNNDTRRKESRL
jgi:hypothetical protein